MPGLKASPTPGAALKRGLLLWAFPRLAELPTGEWEQALARARDAEFDTLERVALVAGVAFVAYLLRFDAEQALAISLPLRYLIQFVAAVPLLVLAVGPVHLRRARRGLDAFIAARHGFSQGGES